MYAFVLNMWILGKVNESFVEFQYQRGRVTRQERDMILSTPQVK